MSKVAVVGANGQVGKRVVSIAMGRGHKVLALTRPGTSFAGIEPLNTEHFLRVDGGTLTEGHINVCDPDTMSVLTPDLDAVIFCASASSKGGKPAAVDRDGVINVAQHCLDKNIPRLIVVSSCAVTRPRSCVYLMLNFIAGGIMKAKFEGESALMHLYREAASSRGSNCAYTIIRPGHLVNSHPKGPAALLIEQGDQRSGEISRWDVAALCVEAITCPSASNKVFECYNNTGKREAGVNIASYNDLLTHDLKS